MSRSSPHELHAMAAAAGLQRQWRDVDGNERTVGDDALAAILAALGGHRAIPADTLPPMLVTDVGTPTRLPTRSSRAELTDAHGRSFASPVENGVLPPLAEPGYYELALAEGTCTLAVAPARCPLPISPHKRLWGTSLQIPALRGTADRAFGGLGELDDAIRTLASAGCGAVAINPVHALLPGNGEDFSPYSPSSRTYLNAALADPALLGLPPLPEGSSGALIDWPSALPAQLHALRSSFARLDAAQRARIAEAVSGDEGLYRHALHDALYCSFRSRGAADWRQWPTPYRDPRSPAVSRFAAQNGEEIEFHLYSQWLAREGLAAVQNRARKAGMTIGLIADLAVGVRPGGSDCWSMPEAMLTGLTIGAPPDPLGPLGQNWSITGFSPNGLRAAGYRPWIAMLRAALRAAGGLRIDHAFGLSRLWVIPEGGVCADGAYLTYPFEDLARLVTLEAHLADALIVAEDLGTAPPGFTQMVAERGMLGMRVLWFERAEDHGFIGAQDYPANCVAMTGTHDTPTVAGWWRGVDLDWADRLGRLPPGVNREQAENIRAWDRGLLWSTIGENDRPEPENVEPVVQAALAHVGKSPALLAIAPIEDLLAEIEQPNLPGTTCEHPNWRRRLSAPLDLLLKTPRVMERISALADQKDANPAETAA